MTPTPEQELILLEAKTSDNLLIEADAGAAKTTTLCMLAQKLPVVPTLCCAFNKSIATEMSKRMPGHITCKTMNALGHAAWGQKLGSRLTLDTGKVFDITQELGKTVAPTDRKEFNDMFSALMRGVRLAKSSGFVPDSCLAVGEGLCDLEELLDGLASQIDVEPDEIFAGYLIKILEESIAQSFQGKIDFDDQIYMSVCFGAKFPKFPIILVDETQDLSALNHQMLRKMFGGRLIAVGDPKQGIYLFRGAVNGSMELLADEFKMKRMYLHVSFRCPRAVVERARWRAPLMQYPDWAKDGLVKGLTEWSIADIPDGAAVICRNNAPLFTVALRFIRGGRGVKLVGADIGAGLVKILKKFGDPDLSQTSVLGLISEWERKQIKGARQARIASIHDRAECLRVFAEFGQTLGESIAYAEHLFSATGPVLFMSGHKSKGLEFQTVFHLDPFLIPAKHAIRLAEDFGDDSQLWQEKNLRYVIETRSQENLYFIHTEDMV